MKLTVEKKAIALGKAQESSLALLLDSIPVASEMIQLNSRVVTNAAFLTDLDKHVDYHLTIIDLLQHCFKQIEEDISQQPILFIPPTFNASNEESLNVLIERIQQAFPGIFEHPACRIFPYGRASTIMLFSYLKDILNHSNNERVWLLAVDSYADMDRLNQLANDGQLLSDDGNGMIASEGAILASIKLASDAEEGMEVKFYASDATIDKAGSHDVAIEQLFLKLANHAHQSLDQLYLPDNGLDELSQTWVSNYQHLAPIITKDTQMYFTASFTGELGSVSGLYRFLHIYDSYAKGRIQADTMQCEISDKLYRAVALYDWFKAN